MNLPNPFENCPKTYIEKVNKYLSSEKLQKSNMKSIFYKTQYTNFT